VLEEAGFRIDEKLVKDSAADSPPPWSLGCPDDGTTLALTGGTKRLR